MVTILQASGQDKKASSARLILHENKLNLKGSGYSKDELSILENDFELKRQLTALSLNAPYRYVQFAEQKPELYKTLEQARRAGSGLANELKARKIKEITLSCDNTEALLAYAEGLALGSYQFDVFKSAGEKEPYRLEKIYLDGNGISKEDLVQLQALIEGTYITRDLVNTPHSHQSAEELSEAARRIGEKAGFKVEVFNKAKIKSLKMGGLLSVNAGSIDPPTFTIMEWKPAKAKNKKPIVLVGKGVVFDTGGLSLKPTLNSMDLMKSDMAGAAAVIGTMYAIATAKLPVHVIALVPATDNRPGEKATSPGDIITMYDKTTVEVLNTDAEGRLILADALAYAKKFDPQLVMDLATLTGAAARAIGAQGIVFMGTADDDTKSKIKESGNHVYERLVEFPFWDEYGEMIKSDIADLKNVSAGTASGAITAGKFLEHFTSYPWLHFDIAGPAFNASNDYYRLKNGTGVGVRLLFHFIKNNF